MQHESETRALSEAHAAREQELQQELQSLKKQIVGSDTPISQILAIGEDPSRALASSPDKPNLWQARYDYSAKYAKDA